MFWENRGKPSTEKNYAGAPLYYINEETSTLLVNPTMYDNRNPITGKLNLPESAIIRLEKTLSKTKRRILIYGEDAMYEGLVFAESFDPDLHIIDATPGGITADTIPDHWRRFRGIDYGFAKEHPYVCVWVAQSPEGKHYVYREFVGIRMTTDDCDKQVEKLSANERIDASWDDKKGGDRHLTTVRSGLEVMPGRSDPQGRVEAIENCLLTNRLYIFRGSAPNLVSNFQKFAWPKNTGKTLPSNKPRKLHDDSIDGLGEVLSQVARWDLPEELVIRPHMKPHEIEAAMVHEREKKMHERDWEERDREAEAQKEEWEGMMEEAAEEAEFAKALKQWGFIG
jgi:hypothetical protein